MENIFKMNASYSDEAKSILKSTIVSPEIAINPNFLYIQEAGFFSVNDLFYTKRTALDSFMLIYTTAGSANISYAGMEFTLLPHSCVLFHCMKDHYYRTTANSGWEHLWIHFNGCNALAYYEEFVQKEWRPIQFEPDSMMEAAFRQILSIHHNTNITANLITAHLLTNIVTELILKNIFHDKAENIPHFVQSIREKISENYTSAISIDQLAHDFHIDKFYMMKEFKKYMGTTIFEYIILLRISYAKKLLKYSDLSVTEISSECGINTVTHFIKLFKQREQMTPLVYRKKWKCIEVKDLDLSTE